LVFCGFFALLALRAYWFKHELVFALVFVGVSLAFLGVSLLFPKILAPLNWLWTRLGLLLHKIVSPIILGAQFFLLFTCAGAIMRLFGGDPLRLRFDAKASSYWIERTPPGPAAESLKEQF
jgi:hypothetical protein